MAAFETQQWLELMGYARTGPSLHVGAAAPKRQHRYGPELHALLDPHGAVRAEAVFDVEGVPTVCFLKDDGLLTNQERLDTIRRRVWNQNLISIIMVLGPTDATPVPVAKQAIIGEPLYRRNASAHGAYSAADVQSGDIYARHADWFKHEERVDAYLLRNLNEAVRQLSKKADLSVEQAQELMGQLLFLSYLEDRGIVSNVYWQERRVSRMGDLVSQRDRAGIVRLLKQLKTDFNGDFLEPEPGEEPVWKGLSDAGFDIAQQFLSGGDMASGQQRFWGYDFSFMPALFLLGDDHGPARSRTTVRR